MARGSFYSQWHLRVPFLLLCAHAAIHCADDNANDNDNHQAPILHRHWPLPAVRPSQSVRHGPNAQLNALLVHGQPHCAANLGGDTDSRTRSALHLPGVCRWRADVNFYFF